MKITYQLYEWPYANAIPETTSFRCSARWVSRGVSLEVNFRIDLSYQFEGDFPWESFAKQVSRGVLVPMRIILDVGDESLPVTVESELGLHMATIICALFDSAHCRKEVHTGTLFVPGAGITQGRPPRRVVQSLRSIATCLTKRKLKKMRVAPKKKRKKALAKKVTKKK